MFSRRCQIKVCNGSDRYYYVVINTRPSLKGIISKSILIPGFKKETLNI